MHIRVTLLQPFIHPHSIWSMATNLTGYGGAASNKLLFDGNADNFELWEVKFRSFLRLNSLHEVLSEPAAGATRDSEKNAKVFALLVQFLDDTSLSLIIRDCKDKGKEALDVLKEHYIGCSKPRVISLYCELTSLKKAVDEDVTSYVLRAETAAARLKQTGEQISDALLVAMAMKGLPESFKTFNTVIGQTEDGKISFEKFKGALKTFEENEKARMAHFSETSGDVVMKFNATSQSKIVCYRCNQRGHKSFQCDLNDSKSEKPKSRWCTACKTNTHDTKFCNRKKVSAKSAKVDSEEDKSFIFKVSVVNCNSENEDNYLIDCGATTHIVCKEENFFRFDQDFDPRKHVIELADGTRQNSVVTAKGDAKILI